MEKVKVKVKVNRWSTPPPNSNKKRKQDFGVLGVPKKKRKRHSRHKLDEVKTNQNEKVMSYRLRHLLKHYRYLMVCNDDTQQQQKKSSNCKKGLEYIENIFYRRYYGDEKNESINRKVAKQNLEDTFSRLWKKVKILHVTIPFWAQGQFFSNENCFYDDDEKSKVEKKRRLFYLKLSPWSIHNLGNSAKLLFLYQLLEVGAEKQVEILLPNFIDQLQKMALSTFLIMSDIVWYRVNISSCDTHQPSIDVTTQISLASCSSTSTSWISTSILSSESLWKLSSHDWNNYDGDLPLAFPMASTLLEEFSFINGHVENQEWWRLLLQIQRLFRRSSSSLSLPTQKLSFFDYVRRTPEMEYEIFLNILQFLWFGFNFFEKK